MNKIKNILLLNPDSIPLYLLRSIQEELVNTFVKFQGFEVNIVTANKLEAVSSITFDLVVYVPAVNSLVRTFIHDIRKVKSEVPILVVVDADTNDDDVATKACRLEQGVSLVVGENVWNFLGAMAYHLLNDPMGRFFMNYIYYVPLDLLVEDELSYANAIFNELNENGNNIISSTNPDAALVIFQKLFECITHVVSDYNFAPDQMKGVELMIEFRKISDGFYPAILTDYAEKVLGEVIDTKIESIPVFQKTEVELNTITDWIQNTKGG